MSCRGKCPPVLSCLCPSIVEVKELHSNSTLCVSAYPFVLFFSFFLFFRFGLACSAPSSLHPTSLQDAGKGMNASWLQWTEQIQSDVIKCNYLPSQDPFLISFFLFCFLFFFPLGLRARIKWHLEVSFDRKIIKKKIIQLFKYSRASKWGKNIVFFSCELYSCDFWSQT